MDAGHFVNDEQVYSSHEGRVQAWLGPIYVSRHSKCQNCGAERDYWVFQPRAFRVMGPYAWSFRVVATFDGTPLISDIETAKRVGRELAKRLEAMPDLSRPEEGKP